MKGIIYNLQMKSFLIAVLVLISTISITLYGFSHTPDGWTAKGFAIGSSVCHQIPSHSFFNHDQQFPLCARCSGLYLGSFMGLIYFFSQGRKKGIPSRGYLILLAALSAAWAGDGLNSLISDFVKRPFLYETTNFTRLVTGFGMGFVMSVTLVTLFNAISWKSSLNQPLVQHLWQIVAYAVASTMLGLLLVNSDGFIFQSLASFSILTVMLILTMLYTIFWIILFRKENSFQRIVDISLFFLAGFASAIAQVQLLNLLRSSILG